MLRSNRDYKKGKFFLLAAGCVGKFAKTPDKLHTQANRQLVQQTVQTNGWPDQRRCHRFVTKNQSRRTRSPAFCCGNCKAKGRKRQNEGSSDWSFGEKGSPGYKKATGRLRKYAWLLLLPRI